MDWINSSKAWHYYHRMFFGEWDYKLPRRYKYQNNKDIILRLKPREYYYWQHQNKLIRNNN